MPPSRSVEVCAYRARLRSPFRSIGRVPKATLKDECIIARFFVNILEHGEYVILICGAHLSKRLNVVPSSVSAVPRVYQILGGKRGNICTCQNSGHGLGLS
jgi:hypothetical protein